MRIRSRLSRSISALALAGLLACSRQESSEAAAGGEKSPGAEPREPAPQPVADTSFRVPAAPRVVAFGDVHGDLAATRAALRLAGAIDAEDRWIGGALVVVQTGDQLDRGDEEREILDLFDALRDAARAAGGAFHALNGNHEVMNVAADFRYVTPGGFAQYSGTSADGARSALVERFSAEQRGRAAAFLPGGPEAKRLAERPVVIAVGDSVFVHGGLLEEHVRYGLGRTNTETRRWMLGETATMPRILQDGSGPIWTREYSEATPTAAQCETLGRTLASLAAKRLVVGHTVQKDGVNSACAGKVWRIDVGLAKYYGGKPSVLEIAGDRVRVLDAENAPVPAASIVPSAAAPRPSLPKPAEPGSKRRVPEQPAAP